MEDREVARNIFDQFKQNYSKEDLTNLQNKCEHKNLQFYYTYDDFYDGDSDDNFICKDCGKRVVIYVGR